MARILGQVNNNSGRVLGQVQQPLGQAQPEKEKGFFSRLGSSLIQSEKGLGESIAGAIIPLTKSQKTINEVQQRNFERQSEVLQLIKEKQAKGEDTTKLKAFLNEMSKPEITQEEFNPAITKSNKQVLGEGLGVLTDVLGAGTFGKAGKIATTPKTFWKGALKGAGAGAVAGGTFGTAQGVARGMQEDLSTGQIAEKGALGGLLGGVTGGVIGGVTGGVSGFWKGRKTFQEETRKLLEEKPNSTVAKYKLSGEGKVVNDPIAKEAIKQGVDEGTVATVKGSSATDKMKMNKMLDILDESKVDPKFGATNRPSDVVGDSVLERFNIVQKANQTAGKQLNDVAKNLKGQTVDPTEVVQSFMSNLDDLGVTFKNGKAIYNGSQIEGLTEPQRIIDTIVKRMNNVSDDAYEIHNLKKFIDEQVTYGKTGGGLTGRAEGILKQLRNNLDAILDKTFKQYNTVNTTYATTRNAIDDFVTSAGTKFDPNVANANARIGTLMRRILSNAQSRTNVLNAMQNLQEVAEANGGKFKDDVITQTVFVDNLEKLFGTQAPTSLAGEVSKGVQKTTGVIGELRKAEGIVDLVLEYGAGGIEKLQNINPEGLSKALRELLK